MDTAAYVREVKVPTKTMQGALHPLWHPHGPQPAAPLGGVTLGERRVSHQVVDESPGRAARAYNKLTSEGDQGRVSSLSLMQTAEEVKAWSRDSHVVAVFGVMAGESICHHVQCAWLVFHHKVKPDQLF